MRDDERQQDEGRRERDDEREHDARDDGGRCRALALVGDLAEVRGLLHGRMNRMVAEALVLRGVGRLIVLHSPTIASRAAHVFTANVQVRYPPAGIRGPLAATGHDGRWR
jgi:hypothetical protein